MHYNIDCPLPKCDDLSIARVYPVPVNTGVLLVKYHYWYPVPKFFDEDN